MCIKKFKQYIAYRLKSVTIGYVTSEEMVASLRKQGMTIGEGVRFYAPWTIVIDITRPFAIKIGNNVNITAGVTILTHGYDWSVAKGVTGEIFGSFGEVVIGDNVFIGTKSTILKGVHIGDNVIIGANSLVNKDCESNFVYAGVPAKKIMSVQEYIERGRAKQLKEAQDLAICYFNRYGEFPEKQLFDEFFFLFENREKPLDEKFEKKLTLQGTYDMSMKLFLSGKGQIFESYEDFLTSCKEKMKAMHDKRFK